MLDFFRGENVVILRKTFIEDTDENGWGLPAHTTQQFEVEAIVAFRNTTKINNIEEEAINTELKLIFDQGTVIFPEDIFVVRGTLWEKDGESLQPNPQTFVDKWLEMPVIVNIKQYKGNVGQFENTKEGYEVSTDNG